MKHLKKVLILLFVFIFIGVVYIIVDINSTSVEAVTTEYSGFKVIDEALRSGYYDEYLSENDEYYKGEDIIINPTENYTFNKNEGTEDALVQSIAGKTALRLPEAGDCTWIINAPQTGFYSIKVQYYFESLRSSAISRGIKINGEYPFAEAQTFTLTRIWQDEYDIAKNHVEGKHDIKPAQIEKLRWNEMSIRDTEGYYDGKAYCFYLQEGENAITFVEDKEPVYISQITLYYEKELSSYKDVYKSYTEKGYKEVGNANTVQGESAYEKSSTILSPVANWSSYNVDPYVKFKTIYNTIGGTTWRVAGDWISWNIQVPEDGLYCLTFKVLQNYSRGMYSTRRLYLNGEVPFKECENILFEYDSDWQNVTLGNEDGAFYFFLKANQDNIITLEATVGIYNDIVKTTKDIITKLNSLYREVVMIAGITPEKYQNYFLAERITGLWDTIDNVSTELQECIDLIIDIAGTRSSLVSSFERTLYQLNKFKGSETNILTGLDELDDNISGLGTLVMTISEQSLAIDKIYVHEADAELEKASTNFFQKLWHELVMLIGSYGANTSLESSVEAVGGPKITVWIMSGRDQSQLLRQLIDESFTMQKGINVELKLVTSSVLLPATLTDNGPDVAIGVGQNIPVNWGIRNAVIDLSTFSDFDDVVQAFHETAMTPFTFNGKTYALPDTQDFQLTFVRKDIVEEIGVSVPKTWDEVEDILPVLQRRYLEYYIPNTKGTLSTVLYSMILQNGGTLYNENGSATLLNDKKAEEAFIRFTKFFSDKGFSVSANFSNRFRTGEMPIGIANYSLYNTLAVFAPDIKGQWEFDMFPGYVSEEGITNYSTSTSTGTIILEQSTEKEAAWEFVKWWLGTEAQLGYARGMEAILGAAARYPTANLDAFNQLPWSNKEKRVLNAQRELSKGIPTVPGDYIVGRYIDNAFRAVLNKNVNPRDSLFDYCKKINIELARKREEFGLQD